MLDPRKILRYDSAQDQHPNPFTHALPMNETSTDAQDTTHLGRRLEQAQARHRPRATDSEDSEHERDNTALGMAMRLGLEMVLSVCVAAFIGWGLDQWLGTAPWLFLLFVPLGIAAAIMKVVRTARSMQHPGGES